MDDRTRPNWAAETAFCRAGLRAAQRNARLAEPSLGSLIMMTAAARSVNQRFASAILSTGVN